MQLQNPIQIGKNVTVGRDQKLLVIAGPCQIESTEHCLKVASLIADVIRRHPVSWVFKASYDKANRTALNSARGVGIEAGLQILAEVRAQYGVPVLTDIHSPEEAALAAKTVDVLQIPAFLCRQTDLLIAAGKTGRVVQIKKGQFLPAADLKFAAEKVCAKGPAPVLFCERGNCFGYRDLIVDFRNFQIMRELSAPVIFDATHSVQVMGGADGKSSGARQYVSLLSRAAVAAGVDGLFLECHDSPDTAPSDGPNMLTPAMLDELLISVCRIRAAV